MNSELKSQLREVFITGAKVIIPALLPDFSCFNEFIMLETSKPASANSM